MTLEGQGKVAYLLIAPNLNAGLWIPFASAVLDGFSVKSPR